MELLYWHLSFYSFTFFCSYLTIYSNFLPVVSSLLLGWSIFGLTSVGHELYHLTKRSKLQSLLAFVCLDLWVTSGEIWMKSHNENHHQHVWSPGEEEHLIEGNIFINFFHTFKTLIKVYDVFNWKNRYSFLFRLCFFAPLPIYATALVYSSVTFYVTFLTFIAHTAPILNENESYLSKQMHRSVDIFASSSLMLLLCGGFNIHSAHHLNPSQTRGELFSLHQKNKNKNSIDYLCIDTPVELYRLYNNRHQQFSDSLSRWAAIKQGV